MANEVVSAAGSKTKPAIPAILPKRYLVTNGAGVPLGNRGNHDELASADESARQVARETGCGMVMRRFQRRLVPVSTWLRGADGKLHRTSEDGGGS